MYNLSVDQDSNEKKLNSLKVNTFILLKDSCIMYHLPTLCDPSTYWPVSVTFSVYKTRELLVIDQERANYMSSTCDWTFKSLV